MSVSRESHYEPKILKVGQLASALSQLLERHAGPVQPDFRSSEDLEDGSSSLVHFSDPTNAEAICDLRKRHIWTDFRATNGGWIQIHLDGKRDLIRLDVTAGSANTLSDVIALLEAQLGLTITKSPDRNAEREARLSSAEQQLVALNERVASLEGSLRQLSPRLRCFLSYRFGEGNDLLALHVQRFLALLDVEVVTGQGYEPRRISDKISDQLANLHFLILLVLRDGESLWTRDEIATARASGLYVIPVVEEGAQFESGLFGDLEWISVSAGHVGDAYLKLLEAVTYIRTALSVPQ